MTKPKVLVLDIETSPMITYNFGLFDQNIGLDQIIEDSYLLAFSAKWLDEPVSKMVYVDQRNRKDVSDDKELCKKAWKLMDEADIIITQNGISFDNKVLNARFVFHELKAPSSYKNIDTLRIARKHFKFSSNKLEYMTNKLNKKYKKLTHKKFPGISLWKECIKGNKEAWKEMEKYNRWDVLSTEELYHILSPWDNSIDFNIYSDSDEVVCNCGSDDFEKNGLKRLSAGVYQRYRCKDCGKETRGKENLMTPEKRKSLRPGSR